MGLSRLSDNEYISIIAFCYLLFYQNKPSSSANTRCLNVNDDARHFIETQNHYIEAY